MQNFEKDQFNIFVNYTGKLKTRTMSMQVTCSMLSHLYLRKTKNIISSLKVHIPYMLENNVINKITCLQCKLFYVGQMSRTFATAL